MSDNEVFRKKSLDRVKSPENLDDYIQVSNPSVWLLLVAVLVILVGACIWGIFGHIDSTVATTVSVENGTAVCYVSEEDIASVHEGLTVKFDNYQAVIIDVGNKGELGYVCVLETEDSLTDGYYEGKIVTQSYNPLSFILN